MSVGLGIFCSTSDNKLSTNHTVKLNNLSVETVLKSFERNLADLHKLLKLSVDMGFTIFRLGSSFIPFASHPRFQEEWLKPIEQQLKRHAPTLKAYGVRITMHPGQYVVLNSPKREVVERSLAELKYHFWILDTLELDSESVVVVHVGGTYGDKKRAMEKFADTVEENKWLRKRLAVENDERHFNAEEVVELAEETQLPAVFDYYHHKLNQSNFNVDRLLATWRKTTPETHLSSPPPNPRKTGEHGDYVNIEDFEELIKIFDTETRIDVIIEAKKKEKAAAKLITEINTSKPHLAKILIKPKPII
ncbi:MAG: UV DNA damage repair endonuclease UvsE [Thermofilaceae archaeon]|nr:UV DNA damage repair endonuclease UvsE [Thermofilaceae archaeon]